MANLLKLTLGLLLASATAAQVISQAGCLAWNGNQYCSQCDQENMYYQVGNGCVRYSGNGCVSIDYLGRCINCQQGFYLAYGNTCQLVNYIVGCTLYASDTPSTVCRTCAAGYILVQNRCLQTVANCDQYITGTNICARCALGYTQSADWCSCVVGTIQNCVQYDCLGLCVVCNAAFPRLAGNRASCLTWIPYCVSYNPTANGCRTCAAGYVLASDGLSCVQGIAFCKTHVAFATNGTLTCQECLPHYFLTTNQRECVGLIPNCQTIDYTNKVCNQCFPGFVPTDDKRLCLPAIANCVRYQPSNEKSTYLECLVCAANYQTDPTFLLCRPICANGFSVCEKNMTCAAVPQCCELHDGCGSCLTVKAGWVWADRAHCKQIPPECINNHDDCGNCVCPKGQSWCSAQKACVTIPSCCVAHDGCGNCISTTAGFTFCAADKKCYAKPNCPEFDNCGKCICSQPGFSLCPTNNTCAQIPICCPETHNSCGGCNSLLSNYTWCSKTNYCFLKNMSCPNNNDGCGNCVCPTGQIWCQAQLKCVVNVICPAGSVSDGCGSCVCNQNAGRVVYCAATNQCVTIPSCAATWDVCGTVQTWNVGFGWCAATRACYQIPSACPNPAQHYCQNSTCVCTAAQTWCAASSRCFDVPSCCATNDGCGNCLTTIPNTVFVGGRCYTKVTVPNCAQYDPTFQRCTLCNNPYLVNLEGTVCMPPIAKCLTYQALAAGDTIRVCTECERPFLLTNGICNIYLCDQHVYTFTAVTCNKCRFDLINPDKTVCFEQIQFCSNYNLSGPIRGNCIECILPYLLEPSPMGVCKLYPVEILTYVAGSSWAVGGSGLFGLAMSLSDQKLFWLAYNSANYASAAYGWAWELALLTGETNKYSIRMLATGFAPGATTAQSLNWLITAPTSGSTLSTNVYQAQSAGNNVAILQQQWIIAPHATINGAVTIRNVATGQYLGYGINTVATPQPFYFKARRS